MNLTQSTREVWIKTPLIPSFMYEPPGRVLFGGTFFLSKPSRYDIGSRFGFNAFSWLFFVLRLPLGDIFFKFFPRLFDQILILLHLVGQSLFDRWHDFRP